MVLMSSRMCLVEVPGGPSRSSAPMLFSAARSAAAKDELVCSSLCWAWPGPEAPVLSGLGGGTGRGPSRGASLGPENASWVQATDTGLGAVPAPGTLMRAAGAAGGSISQDGPQVPPPPPHLVVSAGQGPGLRDDAEGHLSFLPEPCPVPPQPQATPKHTWNQISSFASIFHTPQLFHKIFLFYIFYTNVTKRWEGREADSVFYAYKWVVVGGGRGKRKQGLYGNTESSDSKKWGGE